VTTVKPRLTQLAQLVGNPAAYALQREDGTWKPVREPLTPIVLRRHLEARITVGTYIVRPPDYARTLVFDIDAGDEDEQQKQLSAILDVLAQLGLKRGVEFSGRKGYHVWVLSSAYMPAAVLQQLGHGVREEAGYPKMEVFPKQTQVRDLGNLVKLPGGIHRVTGKENNYIGLSYVPAPNSAEDLADAASLYPVTKARRIDAPDSQEYPCVRSIQDGVGEGSRNTNLLHLAVMLRKFSLTSENVATIVQRANSLNEPPLDDAEVWNIIENSANTGPLCKQLGEDVHCGGQCITERHPGLYTRAGALKWSVDGEAVVVTVESRTMDGQMLELGHPDAGQIRGTLKEAK
jgi:hypothetical protein